VSKVLVEDLDTIGRFLAWDKTFGNCVLALDNVLVGEKSVADIEAETMAARGVLAELVGIVASKDSAAFDSLAVLADLMPDLAILHDADAALAMLPGANHQQVSAALASCDAVHRAVHARLVGLSNKQPEFCALRGRSRPAFIQRQKWRINYVW
jgi:hypothetical protein